MQKENGWSCSLACLTIYSGASWASCRTRRPKIVSERFSKLRRECVDNYAADLAHYERFMELAQDSGDDYWHRIFQNGLRVAHEEYRATLEGLGGDPDLEVVDPASTAWRSSSHPPHGQALSGWRRREIAQCISEHQDMKTFRFTKTQIDAACTSNGTGGERAGSGQDC